MSELRKDIIGGRWVIIAIERSKRPDDFRPAQETQKNESQKFCPFCEGNEIKTPPEVFAIRRKGSKPDQPGWLVRVVPNKFPALSPGLTPKIEKSEDGLFFRMEGIGVHEVIIESPNHKGELADFRLNHLEKIIDTYQNRMLEIQKEKQYKYLHLFKNKGREAGASLSHPHSQLVATPIVPKRILEELRSSSQFKERFGQCIFCRLIEEELKKGERLVYQNDHFCVLTPFAPRFPFELRLYPKGHSTWFSEITEIEKKSLAQALKTVLVRLKKILSDPPYNFYIHQGPNPHSIGDCPNGVEHYYHWHLEIIPILTKAAGFEWGTGFYINPVSPETAAAFLRPKS
ncbi:MAG: galactose-1-phosphate uridylyltransferase [Candidatus Aminicenantes bacterium]|nr:galactose-1-phosphate uridylyltransferase [Candidatus Aminicenantes bacterium]